MTPPAHPYADLPPTAFWRTGVAQDDPFAPAGLVRPKFRLGRDSVIATAGSCFAQHVGRALRGAGLNVLDAEPALIGMTPAQAADHGYGLFSARYGNIYTARQMRQLAEDAEQGLVDPAEVWTRPDGRFVDGLRPTLDPGGYDTADEVIAARRLHLRAVRGALSAASHLVLTLGLTETWADRRTGRVWPVCPGVAGGRFDPDRHRFLNLRWPDVIEDLEGLRATLHRLNPAIRMILTVSPVPLTATASGDHVLAATTRSKATLRAAAGDFAETHEDVDYFPAYEIVTHPAARGAFYAPNLREVRPQGVATVMAAFMAAHGLRAKAPQRAASDEADTRCDELLLDAFAGRG